MTRVAIIQWVLLIQNLGGGGGGALSAVHNKDKVSESTICLELISARLLLDVSRSH